MINSAAAVQTVLQHVSPGPTEVVSLSAALGRRLATPITCDMDYPPFNRAMMDGFAVRSADVTEPGARLRIIGSVAAGSTASMPLGPGQAFRINTGAPMPEGADTVIPIEVAEVAEDGSTVTLQSASRSGKHVAPQASCVRKGQTVLEPGLRLDPPEMATAAAAGVTEVEVYARATVGILSTGDELVPVECTPSPAQIRNSNSSMLDALVCRAGGRAVNLGIAGDNIDSLTDGIGRGLQYDLLCITGGVSMGEYDLVPNVLDDLNCTVRFKKVSIKPGKPTLFATSPEGRLVFGLAGNPIGAMVAFLLFVEPALNVLHGGPAVGRQHMTAVLASSVAPVGDRESYWPAALTLDAQGHVNAEPLSWHGSGDPFGVAGANGLMVRPPGGAALKPGDRVAVLALRRI